MTRLTNIARHTIFPKYVFLLRLIAKQYLKMPISSAYFISDVDYEHGLFNALFHLHLSFFYCIFQNFYCGFEKYSAPIAHR